MLNYLPELARRGIVHRFYMSHKGSTARALGLPTGIVRNFPAKEYLLRGYGRVFNTLGYETAILAVHRLWEAQVLHDWSEAEHLHLLAQGAGVRLSRRARADGSRILCEVVNTHPMHRLALMQAEAERWGLKPWRNSLLRREEHILEEVDEADALLAPTQHVAHSFRMNGFTKPIHVLPYAANIDRFTPLPSKQSVKGSRPIRIISVGQIGLRKGQLHLLEAASRLDCAPEITLVGAIDSAVQSLLARHTGRFVHIPRVAPDNMPSVLANHDVFVTCSLEEGLAVSVCEAMAMGLAVIATHESGASEVLENDVHGLLFSATDQTALSNAIKRLDADRETMARLGAAAFAQTRSLVNWQGYTTGLEKIYAAG